MQPAIEPVRQYLMDLQDEIVQALEDVDGVAEFLKEDLPGPNGALSRPRVLEGGRRIEKAAVQFTHSLGASLPPAATERNPHLAGHGFQATAISLIVHPVNPYVERGLFTCFTDGNFHLLLNFFDNFLDPGRMYSSVIDEAI